MRRRRDGRSRNALVPLCLALAAFAPRAKATEAPPPLADPRTAQQTALQGLVDGDARFVDGKQAPHVLGAERRRGLARGQHPQADVLRLVMPAVVQAEKAGAPDLLNASIDANVTLEARALVKRSPVIAERVKAGKLRIITAVYDLESGKVEFRNRREVES